MDEAQLLVPSLHKERDDSLNRTKEKTTNAPRTEVLQSAAAEEVTKLLKQSSSDV